MVAEPRDVHASLLARLQHGDALGHLVLLAVDEHGDGLAAHAPGAAGLIVGETFRASEEGRQRSGSKIEPARTGRGRGDDKKPASDCLPVRTNPRCVGR